jgi:hypothetical protein
MSIRESFSIESNKLPEDFIKELIPILNDTNIVEVQVGKDIIYNNKDITTQFSKLRQDIEDLKSIKII